MSSVHIWGRARASAGSTARDTFATPRGPCAPGDGRERGVRAHGRRGFVLASAALRAWANARGRPLALGTARRAPTPRLGRRHSARGAGSSIGQVCAGPRTLLGSTARALFANPGGSLTPPGGATWGVRLPRAEETQRIRLANGAARARHDRAWRVGHAVGVREGIRKMRADHAVRARRGLVAGWSQPARVDDVGSRVNSTSARGMADGPSLSTLTLRRPRRQRRSLA